MTKTIQAQENTKVIKAIDDLLYWQASNNILDMHIKIYRAQYEDTFGYKTEIMVRSGKSLNSWVSGDDWLIPLDKFE